MDRWRELVRPMRTPEAEAEMLVREKLQERFNRLTEKQKLATLHYLFGRMLGAVDIEGIDAAVKYGAQQRRHF